MSEELTHAFFFLAAALAFGMAFVAYVANRVVETMRMTTESLNTAVRSLEIARDIIALHDKVAENSQ